MAEPTLVSAPTPTPGTVEDANVDAAAIVAVGFDVRARRVTTGIARALGADAVNVSFK